MKIIVPTNFSELKVGQLVELTKLRTMEPSIRRRLRVVEALSGLDYDILIKLDMATLMEIEQCSLFAFEEPNRVEVKKSYKLGGIYYAPVLDLSKATAGQYIDAKSIIEQGIEVNIHKLIACYLMPLGAKYNEETHLQTSAAVYDHMSVEDAWSLALFFCKVFNLLTTDFQTYSVSEAMNKVLDKMMDLKSTGVG